MSDLEINNDCWSLIAVVRECSRKANFKPLTPSPDCSELAATTTTATRAATPFNGGATQNCFLESPNSLSVAAHDIAATDDNSWFDELINLYKPFMARYSTSDATYNDVTLPPRPSLPDQLMQRGCFLNRKLGSCSIGASHHQTISMKKNKYEEKRVCKVSGKDLSSDKWAWRKYGQKPIKGSPYPRNYYRCSSYKGCGARKQVERSPIDPNIYIVTYTGHHHHSRPTPRNTLGDRVKLSVTHPLDNPGSPETASSSNHSGSGSGDFETKIDPNTLADSDPMMGIEQLMKGSDPDEDWRIGLRGGNE